MHVFVGFCPYLVCVKIPRFFPMYHSNLQVSNMSQLNCLAWRKKEEKNTRHGNLHYYKRCLSVKEKEQDNKNINIIILQISVALQAPWWKFHHKSNTVQSDLNESPGLRWKTQIIEFIPWWCHSIDLLPAGSWSNPKNFQLNEIQNALWLREKL